MPDMNPYEAEIDHSLRRVMAGPVPGLSPDFDERLMREVSRRAQPLDRYGRALLAGYGLLSVGASAVVMRGQGLDWSTIAATILGPIAAVAAAFIVRRVNLLALPYDARHP